MERIFYPKKYGVICGDEKFTYSQFGERFDRLSNTKSVDFIRKLPKMGTGKIYKKGLRD